MKKEIKKPKRMTADETMAHIFGPKVAKLMREHVNRLSEEKEKPKK